MQYAQADINVKYIKMYVMYIFCRKYIIQRHFDRNPDLIYAREGIKKNAPECNEPQKLNK
jgi:hypothetical protein